MSVLPEIVTPSTTAAYMDRVNGEYNAFNIDVHTGPMEKLPKSFLTGWMSQMIAWGNFYVDRRESWTLGWTAADYNETENYERALIAYREQFTLHTGQRPKSPGPLTPSSATAVASIPWDDIILGGCVLGGLFVAYKVVSSK